MEIGNKNGPPKNLPDRKETVIGVQTLFTEAEAVLAAEGRDRAKTLLPGIYAGLIALNGGTTEDWETTWVWNPNGGLTKEEFDTLNLRRKLLSNAIGIMTASGIVRHDLNII